MAITTQQFNINKQEDIKESLSETLASCQLIFAFGNRYFLEDNAIVQKLQEICSDAHFISCSTSGQIAGTNVSDEGLILTGISFEHTELVSQKINISEVKNSYKAGLALSQQLPAEQLKHVLLFSDGHHVNGDKLVEGFNKNLPSGVTITGGLAGDDARFEKTLLGLNQLPDTGNIIAVGLYGDHLQIASSHGAGFDTFGPRRSVTKSKDNKLYQLDNKDALDLYKNYLGDLADDLPGSALFFPLALTTNDGKSQLVRTILSVDESTKSMTFAGDIPEGSTVQLMRCNPDHLVDGVYDAANKCLEGIPAPQLALLISCVGRKIVLDQRIEEETEAIQDTFGDIPTLGFYSYGEICPVNFNNQFAQLHNQTMTITTFAEL